MADSQTPPPEEPSGRPSLQELVGEALAQALERLVRRGREEAGRVARTGRQHLAQRQLQRDLDHFWVRLGKTAYHLTRGGEIDHPALRRAMERIDELEAKIDAIRRAGPTGDPEIDDPLARRTPPH